MRIRTKDPDGFIDGARRDRCAIVAEAVREWRAVDIVEETKAHGTIVKRERRRFANAVQRAAVRGLLVSAPRKSSFRLSILSRKWDLGSGGLASPFAKHRP